MKIFTSIITFTLFSISFNSYAHNTHLQNLSYNIPSQKQIVCNKVTKKIKIRQKHEHLLGALLSAPAKHKKIVKTVCKPINQNTIKTIII